MIGSAKITYTNEHISELVRKDLLDKFGNRELANYNLYIPGVIKPSAVVTQFPNPTITITSVEDQIKSMGVYPKQSVPRGPKTVSVISDFGGSTLSATFDYQTDCLQIDGSNAWVEAETAGKSQAAHWCKISVRWPSSFTYEEGDIIAYTENGEPKFKKITAEDLTLDTLYFIVDAKFTTMNLGINWNDDYATENINIVNKSSLANAAITKIEEFPTEPKFSFDYPKSVIESTIQVDVDLDLGKN